MRFELPSRLRHLDEIAPRYADWDLSHVWLWDERQHKPLARIFPLDKRKNADGQRRVRELPGEESEQIAPQAGLPPLLQRCIDRYRATGLPPAYIPLPMRGQGDLADRTTRGRAGTVERAGPWMASVESTAPPALRLKRLPANVGIARVQIAIGLGPRPVTAPPD
ncbi:MAG TPA: hypothetical protein DFS52_31495 [Myxococcales bacterium]|nr:hypothetical protein [Myxococcales bacterium]